MNIFYRNTPNIDILQMNLESFGLRSDDKFRGKRGT